MTATPWRVLSAALHGDPRGRLAVLDEGAALPFLVRRVFYVYDVPLGGVRGAHAHRTTHQLLACVTGAVDVTLDDGARTDVVRLRDPAVALYIPPLVWATQACQAPGTVYFVLASEPYDEREYLRNYDDFLRTARSVSP